MKKTACALAVFASVAYPLAHAEMHVENPEWSLYDNFEGSKDTSFWGGGIKVDYGVSCSSDPNAKGKVLAFTYRKDDPEPGHGWSEQRYTLPLNVQQIEMSYRLFVPKNYIHAPGNHKNFVFWSGEYGTSNANVWASSESWPTSGGTLPSTYIGQDGANYGHAMVKNGPKLYLDNQGSWIDIHIYLELAKHDGDVGLFEVHRDGVLVTGTTHPDIDPPRAKNSIKYSHRGNYVDRGYLLGWANGGFDRTTVFCIDDFSVKANSGFDDVSETSNPKPPSDVDVSDG